VTVAHSYASFASIAEAMAEIDAESALIDGEAIVSDEHGRSNFHALQADIAKGRSDRMTSARSICSTSMALI